MLKCKYEVFFISFEHYYIYRSVFFPHVFHFLRCTRVISAKVCKNVMTLFL